MTTMPDVSTLNEVVPLEREVSEEQKTLFRPLKRTGTDSYGIAFDIDGVLVHGRKPLGGGREAVEFCMENDVPHVFLTNNAMDLEVDRALLLASILKTDVLTDRMIVAHTPLTEEPADVKESLVLVTGFSTSDVRDILIAKGFKNVQTVEEFAAKRPYLVPNKVRAPSGASRRNTETAVEGAALSPSSLSSGRSPAPSLARFHNSSTRDRR